MKVLRKIAQSFLYTDQISHQFFWTTFFEGIGKTPTHSIITEKTEQKSKDAEKCRFCDKIFYDEEEEMNGGGKDLCHITGKYRGAAHTHCNLNVIQR